MNTLRLTIATLALSLGAAACDDAGNTKPAPAKSGDAKPAKVEENVEEKVEKVAKADDAKPDDAKPDDAIADAAGDDEPAEDDAFEGYDPRVAKAARVAEQIATDPQKADEFLATAALDRDKLDALMYEIANDPDLTAQYRVARGI